MADKKAAGENIEAWKDATPGHVVARSLGFLESEVGNLKAEVAELRRKMDQVYIWLAAATLVLAGLGVLVSPIGQHFFGSNR